MTQQLPLLIQPRLAYSADNFIVHQGVAEAFDIVAKAMQLPPTLFVIVGAARSGKSHLAVAVSELLSRTEGVVPRFFDSQVVLQAEEQVAAHNVIIIDEGSAFLRSLEERQDPGAFVALYEACKHSGAKLFLLCDETCMTLPIVQNMHVASRFEAGLVVTLGLPDRDAMEALVITMAKQRDLRLTSSRAQFLARRLPCSISEIEAYLERLHYVGSFADKVITPHTLKDSL